jgi:hypothetical protein
MAKSKAKAKPATKVRSVKVPPLPVEKKARSKTPASVKTGKRTYKTVVLHTRVLPETAAKVKAAAKARKMTVSALLNMFCSGL